MTSPRELDRRVRQHHNDIDKLYELQTQTDSKVDKIDKKVDTIAEVQQEHGNRLAEMQHTLELHETDLSIQSHALNNMRHSMKRLEDGQRKQNKRLDSHGEKLDSHGEKLEEILGLLQQGR